MRTPLLLIAVLTPVSGCIPAGFGPMPTDEPFRNTTLVEYWVQCRDCDVEFWTPVGVGWAEDVEGEFRQVVSFAEPERPEILTLAALPPADDYVIYASISINGRIVVEGGRNAANSLSGDPVRLSACVGRGPGRMGTPGSCGD